MASDLRAYYGANGDHDDAYGDAGEYQHDTHDARRDHDVQDARDIRGAHDAHENRASGLKYGCARANGRPNDDVCVPKVRHPNYRPLSPRVRSRHGSGTHGRVSVRKGGDVRRERCGQNVDGDDDGDGYADCVIHGGVHDARVQFVNWYEENGHLFEYINSP